MKVNARADATGARRGVKAAIAGAVDMSEMGGGANITEPPPLAIAGNRN